MKKMMVIAGLSSMLLLGGCTDKDQADGGVVFKYGNKSYTEGQMMSDIKGAIGTDMLKNVMLSQMLLMTHNVSDKEIEGIKKELNDEFKDNGGIEKQLKLRGITEEDLNKQLKAQVAFEKVLKEMNKVDEKAIKKRYEEVKNGFKVIHVVSTNGDVIEKAKTALEGGKGVNDIRKFANGSNDVVEETTFIKGQVPPFLDEVFKMKKGEVKVIPTITGTHVVKVLDNQPMKYEDVKDDIEKELMYKNSDVDSVLDYVMKKYDIKLSKEYKELIK